MDLWRRRAKRGVPADVEALLARHLGEWPHLDDVERATLLASIETLLRTKRWEAARGFALTNEMCTVIAAQAALVTLGLGLHVLRDVKAIVVHPTTITTTATRPGPISGSFTDEPVHVDGEAHHLTGPMLLAWDAVRRDTRRFGHGLNVVVHEIAHKLDMLDGLIDGTPPLPVGQRERWVEVCTRHFSALRDGVEDRLLRDYAATDTGEFFAVATEVFFDRPVELATQHPDLYAVLRDYFLVDPVGRRGAAARSI